MDAQPLAFQDGTSSDVWYCGKCQELHDDEDGARYCCDVETGSYLIACERMRQIQDKGWDSKHDDKHTDRSLLNAAILLALDVYNGSMVDPLQVEDWPDQLCLRVRENYGTDVVRRLTIAGAMIAAEIDRLQRQKPSA
jgi:hypothetical protein